MADPAATRRLIVDRLGEALWRQQHGHIRPLWTDMPAELQDVWRGYARKLLPILESVGLKIVQPNRKDRWHRCPRPDCELRAQCMSPEQCAAA